MRLSFLCFSSSAERSHVFRFDWQDSKRVVYLCGWVRMRASMDHHVNYGAGNALVRTRTVAFSSVTLTGRDVNPDVHFKTACVESDSRSRSNLYHSGQLLFSSKVRWIGHFEMKMIKPTNGVPKILHPNNFIRFKAKLTAHQHILLKAICARLHPSTTTPPRSQAQPLCFCLCLARIHLQT
jgi:hypothetical protein